MSACLSSSDHRYLFSVTTVKVDWLTIAKDINERGMPFTHQANAIGKSWSTMQEWLNGCQPSFPYGHAFLVLHAKVCGADMTLKRLSEFPPIE